MKQKKELTTIEKVQDLFDKYLDTTNAIIEDYCEGNAGMLTELKAADLNLKTAIDELDIEDDPEALFGFIISKLEGLELSDKETAQVVDAIDEDEVKAYVTDDADIFLKIQNPFDRDKLEDFLRREIYPYNINYIESIY